MVVPITDEQRQSFSRAARLLARQAEGLTETGSQATAQAVRDYVATLRKIADSPERVELQDEEKEHIEQASFILEGLENGLKTADFRERASVVGNDARRLYDLVIKYNTLIAEADTR